MLREKLRLIVAALFAQAVSSSGDANYKLNGADWGAEYPTCASGLN